MRPNLPKSALRRLAPVLMIPLLGGCPDVDSKPEEATILASMTPITPTTTTDRTLTANGQVRTPASGAVEQIVWSYSWTVNGADAGITTQSVDSSATTKGETWEVTIGATYGGEPLAPATASIDIVNARPTVAPVVQGVNSQNFAPIGQIVTIIANENDVDGDPVTLTYLWAQRGVAVADTASFDTSGMSSGQTVQWAIRSTDGELPGVIQQGNVQVCISGTGIPGGLCPPVNNSFAASIASLSLPASLDASAIDAEAASSEDGVETLSTLASASASWPGDAIAVTAESVCTIGSGGALACSGADDAGLSDVPEGAFSFVTARDDFACALASEDRSIHCWGAPSDDLGQLSPPEGAFYRIALQPWGGCGLSLDGALACWGGGGLAPTSPPEGSFVDFELRPDEGCALGPLDDVVCWYAEPTAEP